jgi:hypothetical protein
LLSVFRLSINLMVARNIRAQAVKTTCAGFLMLYRVTSNLLIADNP